MCCDSFAFDAEFDSIEPTDCFLFSSVPKIEKVSETFRVDCRDN